MLLTEHPHVTVSLQLNSLLHFISIQFRIFCISPIFAHRSSSSYHQFICRLLDLFVVLWWQKLKVAGKLLNEFCTPLISIECSRHIWNIQQTFDAHANKIGTFIHSVACRESHFIKTNSQKMCSRGYLKNTRKLFNFPADSNATNNLFLSFLTRQFSYNYKALAEEKICLRSN